MQNIMAGFSFVGAVPCVNFEVGPHGVEPLAVPDSFEPGKCYVFHLSTVVEEPVYSLLEKRLLANGIQVRRAPRSERDLVRLTMGGPLFRIDYTQGRYRGSLVAVQDPQIAASPTLRRIWKTEDFIVFFEN